MTSTNIVVGRGFRCAVCGFTEYSITGKWTTENQTTTIDVAFFWICPKCEAVQPIIRPFERMVMNE